MGQITKITQKTHNRFLNYYEFETVNKLGKPGKYFVTSRAESVEELKVVSKDDTPNGVVIYSLYGEKRDKVILIRQFRYPLGGYVYEFPAGLVDSNEDYQTAAIRELKEETGLDLVTVPVNDIYQKPYFTTVGMTDESCATVYGYATGEISKKFMEDSEEIEVVVADREEVRRILREEKVAVFCAYMMMHFLHDEDPFAFLK